jgi:hypothetical protein
MFAANLNRCIGPPLSSQTVGAESAAALLTHARLVAAALPQADERSSPMLHFDFRTPAPRLS